jgi:hypothetical protein
MYRISVSPGVVRGRLPSQTILVGCDHGESVSNMYAPNHKTLSWVTLARYGVRNHTMKFMHEGCTCFEPFWARYGPLYDYAAHVREASISSPCSIVDERRIPAEEIARFGPGARALGRLS